MSSVKAKAAHGKFKGYALVRDKDGHPKVDDLNSLPNEIKQQLTQEDWEYLLNSESLPKL